MNNIETLEFLLQKIKEKKGVIYFLTYDTKSSPRAAIKNIYDMASALIDDGYIAKILVEDKNYSGVESWLGDAYKNIPIAYIKEDKVEINIDDIIVVPEYYSNVLPQLESIRAIKVMLIQQKEYIYETLSIGSKWSDFGFDKVITTTETAKSYILKYFPESLVFIIPPYIDEIFKPTDVQQKPIIAINCRDRNQQRKIISEFYLKYPQLRWITFRDMVQMTYEEFASSLKECMVSVWVDDESTFGTFPLESMKCNVPVIGKIPANDHDWMGENGMWTDDINKITDILANYVFTWIEGIELTNEIKENMKNTTLPYTKEVHNQNTVAIFKSLYSTRYEILKAQLDKIKKEEN